MTCNSDCSKIQSQRVKAGKLRDFISPKKEKLLSEIKAQIGQTLTTGNMVQEQQEKYIKVFLIVYLGYLNELVTVKLVDRFGDLGSRKIGFVLSLEKKLIDEFGTKKDFRELLFASGFLLKYNSSIKVQINTQGEGLLPVLSQRLHLELPLKSYFVLSQLHATYIQITLKQVVKIASNEEEVAAITIQDETIPINDIYEELLKNIWRHTILNEGLVINCPLHCENFTILSNYKEFKKRMKVHMEKTVKK